MAHSAGYNLVLMPEHPRADQNGYVLEHIVVAERVLNRPIAFPEEIHHKDGNGQNNDPDNLVVCPNRSYHKWLHTIDRAIKATGDSSMRKCCHCQQWDNVENLYVRKGSGSEHIVCKKKYREEYKQRTGK